MTLPNLKELAAQSAHHPPFLGSLISPQAARALGLDETQAAALRLCLRPANAYEWNSVAQCFKLDVLALQEAAHDPAARPAVPL